MCKPVHYITRNSTKMHVHQIGKIVLYALHQKETLLNRVSTNILHTVGKPKVDFECV